MNSDDILILAAAPAAAYREYLYRPGGQLARWIGDRFDVVAGPGQRVNQPLQPGDVLLQVALGQIDRGRCSMLQGRDAEQGPRRLSAGQLLLRPRQQAVMADPLPVEPTAAAIRAELGFGPDADAAGDLAAEHELDDESPVGGTSASAPWTGTLPWASVPVRSPSRIPEGDEQSAGTLDEEGEWATAEPQEDLPMSAALADALGKRDWKGALKQAIEDGCRSENDLTNLIFFGQHEELKGRKLDPATSTTDAKLAAEWTKLRDSEVRDAIVRAAENPVMGVAGRTATEFYSEFRGNPGLEFKRRIEWAAAEVSINPGLLATCLLAETGSKWTYLSTGLVSSYLIGTDDFYEMRFSLRSKVPAYKKVGWDTSQVPVVHANDAKRPRNVSSIKFNSGRDALLATAVYLKYGEVYLRDETVKLTGDFDSLPAETRFALIRMTMAAGRAGTRPFLASALSGRDILDRSAKPAVIYQTARNATIRSAQALFLSEWVFGITLPKPAAPAGASGPGLKEGLGGDAGNESEDNPRPDVIRPFPGPITMSREMTNQGFIDCIDRASKPADVTKMCAAVIDLSGDPALPPYAGHNDTDMLYIGSMAKLFAAYTAFELRKRVQSHAKAMISAGLSTADPDWQGKVFADLKSVWQPQFSTAFPGQPPGFPKLAAILELSPDGNAHFLENSPQLTFDELNEIGEFHTPKGKFLDWMKLALGWSSDAAAGKFISALSYPYINGVLGSAGFFDKSTNSGLWVSGNYAGNDWEPDDHAGRPLSPRWQKPGHRVSNFTGTALQVARFLGLLAQGRLVDSQASAELIGIMGTPFLREGLSTATPPRPFASIAGKVGIGTWDGRLHDAAIVTVNPAIKYVIAVLGSPPGRAPLDKLAVALHDCVVSRH